MNLIFVYNADNGMFNALYDTAHKIFSPQTYQCSLCRYTHGLRGMVLPWKKFLDSISCQKTFLHRNEFRAQYPDHTVSPPAVFGEDKSGLQLLLSSEEINSCVNLEQLIAKLEAKL